MTEGPFTQESRFLSLTTPLGKDVLLLHRFTVSERVSSPFRMDLEVLAPQDKSVDPAALLGQTISFSAAFADVSGKKRWFDGIVSEISIGGQNERFNSYRITLVPRLWLATLNHNYRVFQNLTTPDIVRKILEPYGLTTRWNVTGHYTAWDFCFQYRESDFNFISRLLEHEGIFYYFEYEQDNHTLVFGDQPSVFKPSPDQPRANYSPDIGPGDMDDVTEWEARHDLRAGAYEQWDWHFEQAPQRFGMSVDTPGAVAGSQSYKLREYPGRTSQQFNLIDKSSGASSESEKIGKVRIQEIETHNPVFVGSSVCRAFSAGNRFTLAGGHSPGDYVLVSMEHSGAQYPPYLSGYEADPVYVNTFECISYGKPFRPPRIAQRSLVQGPQTALVTEGPDKYGRMRVNFHWGQAETSGWCRVAQRWAGPEWGTIFLPRVGHEVIVDFLDGDPDQPLIVGSVYNAQNMPPYPLPDKYTQCGIKTRSMTADGGTQGGADEFNELRFDDKQGSEDIYFHAQKDFHRVVENDDDLKVGHDQTIEIKNHRTETVKEGNEKITIEKGNRSVYVNTGNDLHQVKQGNREAIVDMGNDTLTVKMGNHIRQIKLGKSETEAMQSITLKVGANKIIVDQSGITLDGIMITLKGKALIKSQAPMQQMNGDAMVIIKGGLTMIN